MAIRGAQAGRRAGLALLLSAALAGCGYVDIGSGSKPVGLVVLASNGGLSTQMNECLSQNLAAYAIFSNNGNPGSTQVRGEWSSDNPGIVAVSDGDLIDHFGFPLPPGTVIARAPGTAVITARYLDFSNSVTVQVGPIVSLTVLPALTDLADNLPQKFRLQVQFDDGGQPRDFTGAAVWELEGQGSSAWVDPNDPTVHTNGPAASSFTLRADLPDCARQATRTLRVSPIQSEQVDYEMGTNATLPVGYSEQVTVSALFAGAGSAKQNITAQVAVDNPFDTALTVQLGQDGNGDDHLYLGAGAVAKQARVTLSLPDGRWSQQTKAVDFVQLDLVSMQVQPHELDLNYPDTGQLQASGTFDGGLTLPITRHVAWTSGDSPAVGVSNALSTAGELFSGPVNEDVTVTAAPVGAPQVASDSAKVRVFAPR